jgi:hypothetical protein
MKNTTFAILLVSTCALAQTATTPAAALPAAPVSTTTTAASASTPSFVYLEASYDAYNTPHVTGSIDYDKQISAGTATSYPTFATAEISFQPLSSPKGAVMTVVQAGVAQGILKIGSHIRVIGVAATGVAVSSTSSTGSFSGGGGVIFKLPKPILGFDHVKVLALSEKTGPTGNLGKYYVGFGRGL